MVPVVFAFHDHTPLVADWCLDPFDPAIKPPIKPQQAVDEALPLVQEVIHHLVSGSPTEAQKAAICASNLLLSGSTESQRGRGQPSTMRHMAVRAYIIRKFNPDPRRPSQSRVGWSRLADILFVNDEKCSRCGLSNHQYDSPCVKALTAEVTRLKAAMNHDGIPF